MSYSPEGQTVAQVREYLRGDITAADALAVVEAEQAGGEKARTTIIEDGTRRAESLKVAEDEAAAKLGAAEAALLNAAPDADVVAEPVEPQPENVDPAETGQTDPPSPAGPDGVPVLTQPSTVKPAQYTGSAWAVGQYAPTNVSRPRARDGQYGAPRDGDLEPGEFGDVVVFKGDAITPAILRTLNG